MVLHCLLFGDFFCSLQIQFGLPRCLWVEFGIPDLHLSHLLLVNLMFCLYLRTSSNVRSPIDSLPPYSGNQAPLWFPCFFTSFLVSESSLCGWRAFPASASSSYTCWAGLYLLEFFSKKLTANLPVDFAHCRKQTSGPLQVYFPKWSSKQSHITLSGTILWSWCQWANQG